MLTASFRTVVRRPSHDEPRGRNASVTRIASTTNNACAIQNDKKIRRNRLFIWDSLIWDSLILDLRLLSRTRKNIPDSPHRLDVFVAIRIPQFLAHFADVHIDAAVKGRKLAAQYRIHQSLARHYPSRLAQKYLQQIKLHRRQIHRLPSKPPRSRRRIQFHVANADHFRRRRRPAAIPPRPPQRR